MNPKLKIAYIGLITAFGLAAGAVVVEAAFIADHMMIDLRQMESERLKKDDDSYVAQHQQKFLSCMEGRSVPNLAMSEAFENWGNRLSFVPRATDVLTKISRQTERDGAVEGLKCVLVN